MSQLLLRAKDQALLSGGVGTNHSYKVGAVLFNKKGKVLVAKNNSYKTHPNLKDFTAYPHLHAESSCILHMGLDNCHGLNLLVTRIRNPNATLTMAKPCPVCYNIITKVGINKLYYTNWQGQLECLS